VHIYYINLERSTLRRERLEKCLNLYDLSFKRIDAVDAENLTDDCVAEYYDHKNNPFRYFSVLKKSEIACFLSHRKALQEFVLNDEADFAILLEDDLEFVADPAPLIKDLELKLNWKIEPLVIKLYSARKNASMHITSLTGGYSLTLPYLCPLNTSAQIFNKVGAIRFLESTQSIFMPVDVTLQFAWKIPMLVLQVQPNLVRSTSAEVGGSTISGKSMSLSIKKIQREIQRPLFRLRVWVAAILNRSRSADKIFLLVVK